MNKVINKINIPNKTAQHICWQSILSMLKLHKLVFYKWPAMTLVCSNTTSSVVPASLSSSFSPMQAITPKSFSRQWATFWPISCKRHHSQSDWDRAECRIAWICINMTSEFHHTEKQRHKRVLTPRSFKNKIPSQISTSSLSPNTWRLSEWPRITQSMPQSLIIAGLQPRRKWESEKYAFRVLTVINGCS